MRARARAPTSPIASRPATAPAPPTRAGGGTKWGTRARRRTPRRWSRRTARLRSGRLCQVAARGPAEGRELALGLRAALCECGRVEPEDAIVRSAQALRCLGAD